MKNIFTLVLSALSLGALAQPAARGLWFDGTDFHIVTIAPSTGIKTDIGVIPVTSATLGSQVTSPNPGTYIFTGYDAFNQRKIYKVNTQTAATTSADLPIDIIEPAYNCWDSLVYGLEFDALASEFQFYSVDVATGDTVMISQLTGLSSIMTSTAVINPLSNSYYFMSVDASNNYFFHEIDISTGSIVNTQPSSPMSECAIDLPTGIIYGITWNVPGAQLAFLNPLTGIITPIAVLNGVSGITMGTGSLDSGSGRYVFYGTDTSSTNDPRLFTVDLSTGGIVYSPLLTDNVMNITVSSCSEPTGIEEEESSKVIGVHPNPANDVITIDSGNSTSNITVYNSLGQPVRTLIASGKTQISIRELNAGIYFVAGDINGKSCRATFIKQ